MQLLPTCGSLITFTAAYRIMVRGAVPARHVINKPASPTLTGSASAVAMASMLRQILLILTFFIPSRRTARGIASICAPGARKAFDRARPNAVEPAEGAVKAVVVDAVAEMHRQRLIRPTPQLKIRKRHWQHSSPQVVVGSAVLAVRTSRHQTSSPRRLKTNNIASIGTRRS